jgi:hypothetical protein
VARDNDQIVLDDRRAMILTAAAVVALLAVVFLVLIVGGIAPGTAALWVLIIAVIGAPVEFLVLSRLGRRL